MRPLVVGFDLDMTLIDSRPGIRATYAELSARTGADIDLDLVTSRLGPPLEHELAHWFPAERIPEVADLYRALYPEFAIARIETMPGATEALAAVRRAGGEPLVITAKNRTNAALHLEHLGLDAEVVGDAWREGKADVLRERDAVAYVGDHVHDMEAARSAGVHGIGVPTGPCSAEELRAAGADRVVASLGDGVAVLTALLEEVPR